MYEVIMLSYLLKLFKILKYIEKQIVCKKTKYWLSTVMCIYLIVLDTCSNSNVVLSVVTL